MNRWLQNQHIAAVVGLIGGALGVLVGLVQAVFGGQLPNWTGNKAAPIALGLLTIVLSLISVFAAVMLRSRTAVPPPRRMAAALGLLLPGSLCFSTGGALWYLPGALLFTAGVYAVLGGQAQRTREVVAAVWPQLLVSVLGGFELLMAVSAGSPITIAVGVVGGIALMAAPWPPSARARIVLLLVGTVPFGILTWWTVAAPVVALLALAIGFTTLRRQRSVEAVIQRR